jgi:hypothetical protein
MRFLFEPILSVFSENLNSMRTFKLIDSLISTTLILVLLYLNLFTGTKIIFLSYFIVGGWQLASMIIHEINRWFVGEGSARRLYHQLVLWMIIVFLALVLIELLWTGSVYFLLIYLYLLLVISPAMAIYYTVHCFLEWRESFDKPMAKLNY